MRKTLFLPHPTQGAEAERDKVLRSRVQEQVGRSPHAARKPQTRAAREAPCGGVGTCSLGCARSGCSPETRPSRTDAVRQGQAGPDETVSERERIKNSASHKLSLTPIPNKIRKCSLKQTILDA